MTFPGVGRDGQASVDWGPGGAPDGAHESDTPARREFQAIAFLDTEDVDPGTVVLTCANCGAQMDERKCKLICRCGYFLSCSDYY
jgi:hypothetical protein